MSLAEIPASLSCLKVTPNGTNSLILKPSFKRSETVMPSSSKS